jgi:transglutaminase/protease-like cytokinesis protein 3
MKGAFCILLALINLCAYSQKKNTSSAELVTPALLAEQLTEKCATDMEKVTAIFRWITDNISYNIKAINKNRNPLDIYDDDDTSKTLKPLDERVAETVLKRRTAVCDGYSRLFKTLCDHIGIRSEIITGYARAGWWNERSRFRSNHKWNAVLIDSSWHLVDATWASGYISYHGDEFMRNYDNKYFMAPPQQFIQDHYPEDLNWTLLKDPPLLGEFFRAPFHYTAFSRSGITSYSPAKGVIEASVGDSIRFEVEVSGNRNILSVTTEPPADFDYDDDFLAITTAKKARCNFKVTDDSAGWLYVVCNGETVLRYKLNIKKKENRIAALSRN